MLIILLILPLILGKAKQSRNRRAVTCDDRPHFACKKGVPQLYTAISQTDGRRFECDLNDEDKNPKWIKELLEDSNFRLSYKLGDRQRLLKYGWWDTSRIAFISLLKQGRAKKGEELTFCPHDTTGPSKSRLLNSRLVMPCSDGSTPGKEGGCPIKGSDRNKCDGYFTRDEIDYYSLYGKYNKKTKKFKEGKAWLKCREPPGPNGEIIARVVCRTGENNSDLKGNIEIQIFYGNRTDTGIQGKWYDVRQMHSDKLFKKSYQPDAIADLGVPHRINIGYCEGEHCYNHYAIPKESDAKTMWQRVDEICKLGAFKVEPYEECTGKDQLPETPEGATSVQCEKKRCWPICEDGKLPEYQQRFKCEFTGKLDSDDNEIFGWHIQPSGSAYPKGYDGLSRCISCLTEEELKIIISSTVKIDKVTSVQTNGPIAYEISCDPMLYNTLKFDWVEDPANPNVRKQKEYIKTDKKPKHLICSCDVITDPQGIKIRSCGWLFSLGLHRDSSRGRKFPKADLTTIECHNSNYLPWNRLKNLQ